MCGRKIFPYEFVEFFRQITFLVLVVIKKEIKDFEIL